VKLKKSLQTISGSSVVIFGPTFLIVYNRWPSDGSGVHGVNAVDVKISLFQTKLNGFEIISIMLKLEFKHICHYCYLHILQQIVFDLLLV
jgi:hypothetical protein